jgi:hypothetical protein
MDSLGAISGEGSRSSKGFLLVRQNPSTGGFSFLGGMVHMEMHSSRAGNSNGTLSKFENWAGCHNDNLPSRFLAGIGPVLSSHEQPAGFGSKKNQSLLLPINKDDKYST